MSRIAFLTVVFLLGVVALGMYACSSKSWTWHQKLTLQIQTAEELVEGSAITSVTWGEHSTLAANFPGGYRGEASVVKIADGRYLFALIKEPTLYLAFWTFENNPSVGEERFARISKIRGTKPVQRQHYPLLVTFTDINDPKTVKRVDPDDMDGALGCSRVQLAADYPWRAQGRTWRQWNKIEAFREAVINAGKEAGLPADVSAYAAKKKLNWAKNLNNVNNSEPEYMAPPKGYEANKEQLAAMYENLLARHGQKVLEKTPYPHQEAVKKLRKTYLARTRDTSKDCHRIKSITLEITDEPVTNGKVEKVLGWLGEYYSKRFDGKRFGTVKTDYPFANSLASGAFDTEK